MSSFTVADASVPAEDEPLTADDIAAQQPAAAPPTTASSSSGSADAIGMFEGKPVHATVAKIIGSGVFEVDDAAWPLDTVISINLMVQVNGVHHEDNKSGKLIRVHRLRVIETTVGTVVPADVVRAGS